MRFFYAQRWSGAATFNFRTNVVLEQSGELVYSGMFD
jgi:hypothetical protein